MNSITIKGGHAGRIEVRKGQIIEISTLAGHQVCDFFGFNLDNVRETLSPSHMRSVMRRIYFTEGDRFWTVLRNPMFEVLQDTMHVHDFCLPPCDPMRYSMDFGIDQHRSCRMNLAEAMADFSIPYEYLPDPVNLFQPTPIGDDGLIRGGMSPAAPGDKVVLLALMNVLAVGSACPQDQTPLNNYKPSDIRFEVRDHSTGA
jgi:uncharacterized protein YcgI (DUF1989 family)